MVTKKEESIKKYFTEEGIKALRNKTRALAKLYNEGFKPGVECMCLGFGKTTFDSMDEIVYRVKELCHITGQKCIIKKETKLSSLGEATITYRMEIKDYPEVNKNGRL
jgi:hypothetical protein